ncbi:hypothetical protein [Streptomyces sp. CBMA123]|nr:hypothetical protein [Streptomyces sp. CBMA123]
MPYCQVLSSFGTLPQSAQANSVLRPGGSPGQHTPNDQPGHNQQPDGE